MKKIALLLVCLTMANILLVGCTAIKTKPQTINYHRRFSQYFPSDNNKKTSGGTVSIDLSEGPKLKYDANLGPQEPTFDIKIVNPY